MNSFNLSPHKSEINFNNNNFADAAIDKCASNFDEDADFDGSITDLDNEHEQNSRHQRPLNNKGTVAEVSEAPTTATSTKSLFLRRAEGRSGQNSSRGGVNFKPGLLFEADSSNGRCLAANQRYRKTWI